MFCGNCFRDNQLVAEFRREGHDVLMIPLYLPMTLEDEDQSNGIPIFFGGINVYLQQKIPFLGRMPDWLHKRLDSPGLLRWAAGRAAKTRASEVGGLTLSMIRGEEGNQLRELKELTNYLSKHERPDVILLSNALLVGMARYLKKELNVPVVCSFQGEDYFLDSLPEAYRQKSWDALAQRSRDIDLFIAPSKYFGDLMRRRLGLPPDKLRIIYNGIQLDGFSPAQVRPDPPVLGYFARMCKEKGLHILIDTYILLRKRNKIPNLKLHVGGGMGPSDEILVNQFKDRLQDLALYGDVTFFPNLTKEQKRQFFRRISVMSVPAIYGEAFGLYLLEAWASGVPVVQPPAASFPELIEETQGGIVADGPTSEALADAIENLLLNEQKRSSLASSARSVVEQRFTSRQMALGFLKEIESVQQNLTIAA